MIVGGAAGPIKAFRAKHRLATVATRKKLAEGTSELVESLRDRVPRSFTW
jgi:hypothetical protein